MLINIQYSVELSHSVSTSLPLYYWFYIYLVPLTPTGFNVTEQVDSLHYNTTITFEWDPPQGSGPETIVDSYPILLKPKSLSHPSLNVLYSSPYIVTVRYNVEHTAVITAVNCAGESSPFTLLNIEYSECVIVTYCFFITQFVHH